MMTWMKKLMLAGVATLGMATPALAHEDCDRQSTFVQPQTYVQPTYAQPTYVQPTYVQPTYVQPARFRGRFWRMRRWEQMRHRRYDRF